MFWRWRLRAIRQASYLQAAGANGAGALVCQRRRAKAAIRSWMRTWPIPKDYTPLNLARREDMFATLQPRKAFFLQTPICRQLMTCLSDVPDITSAYHFKLGRP
jgi:hypothetical protein